MALETVCNTIRSRWKTNIADAETVTTIYDNAPSSQPEDSLFVRLSIIFGEGSMPEIGAQKTFRTIGRMVAQIFDRVEHGDKTILALVDTIIPLFRALTVSGVTFRTPEVSVVGRSGKWWQVNVSCPFYTDEQV